MPPGGLAAAIEDHAAIGDGRSIALITRDGTVDWLCWPRVDSASVFGALLDPDGGRFAVAPVGGFVPSQAWVDATNVLQTRWDGSGGVLEVLDWMPIRDVSGKPETVWPDSALVRRVRCLRGRVVVRVQFDARPQYGRRAVRFDPHGSLGVRIDAGHGLLTLRSSVPLRWGDRRVAYVTLRAGETLALALTWSVYAPAVIVDAEHFARESLEPTLRAWRRWAGRIRYDGPYRHLVMRSALALRLLIFAPSNAIVAAATTSLPERPGGSLNWDYRFAWVRDSALTVRALTSLGFEDEADAYLSWLLHATRLTLPEIGVLYDVYGRPPKPEEELPHWSGWRGARPVRIRNAASDQLQLDSYGEVIDAIAQYVRRGGTCDKTTWSMLRQLGEFVCRNWDTPDAGIWEIRGGRRHFTHSKVLCWVALERLLEIARRLGYRGLPTALFEANRDALRALVETRGWNERIGSYVQELDGETLDASVLLLSWYGFADARSERMRRTARALRARLSPGPGLFYRYEQSLAEGEGAFVICSFWYAELLARGGGTLREAEDFFAATCSYANHLGLFAEEIDPRTGEALGNFPQAFSHVGLISAALALEERRREEYGGVTRPPRSARGREVSPWT